MVSANKPLILTMMLCIFSLQVFSAGLTTFDYSKTWRIVYFQGNSQFVNQRPAEYDPSQGFIFIYEILSKYVNKMQVFNQGADIQSLGIWTQLYLVNDVAYQTIFLGNHTISDGQGWVIMSDEDYSALSQLLVDRKNKTGDPFDGNKEQALNNLLWKDSGEGKLESFDAQIHPSKQIVAQDGGASTEAKPNGSSDLEKIKTISVSSASSAKNLQTRTSASSNSSEEAAYSSSLKGNYETAKVVNASRDSMEEKSNDKYWLVGLMLLLIFTYYFVKNK